MGGWEGKEGPTLVAALRAGWLEERKRRSEDVRSAGGLGGVQRYCTTIVKVVGVPVILPEVAFTEMV
jgi:hypothetical protein